MNVTIALIGYEHVGKSTIINSFIGNKISKINTINESYFNVGSYDPEDYDSSEQIVTNIEEFKQSYLKFPEHFSLETKYNYTFIDIPGITGSNIAKDKHFKHLKCNLNHIDIIFVVFDINKIVGNLNEYSELLKIIVNTKKLNDNEYIRSTNTTMYNLIINKCDSLLGFHEGKPIFNNQEEEYNAQIAIQLANEYNFKSPLFLCAKDTLLFSAGKNNNLDEKDKVKYDRLHDGNMSLYEKIGFKNITDSISTFIESNQTKIKNKHIYFDIIHYFNQNKLKNVDLSNIDLSNIDLSNFELSNIDLSNIDYLYQQMSEINFNSINQDHFRTHLEDIILEKLTEIITENFTNICLSNDQNIVNELRTKIDIFKQLYFTKFDKNLNSSEIDDKINNIEIKYNMNIFSNTFNIDAFKYLYNNKRMNHELFCKELKKNISNSNICTIICEISKCIDMRDPSYLYDIIDVYMEQTKETKSTFYNALLNHFTNIFQSDSLHFKFIASQIKLKYSNSNDKVNFSDFVEAQKFYDILRKVINDITIDDNLHSEVEQFWS
jgi:hypothetical protein